MGENRNLGRGAIFTNRKGKDSHPDWRGDIEVEGKKYSLAGWFKRGQHGEFISLAVSEFQDRRSSNRGGQQRQEQNEPPPLDDDIPF